MAKLAVWQNQVRMDLILGGFDDAAATYIAQRLGDTSRAKRDRDAAAAEGDAQRKQAFWRTSATAPARKTTTTRPPSTSTSKGARTFAALQAFSAEFWKQRSAETGVKP